CHLVLSNTPANAFQAVNRTTTIVKAKVKGLPRTVISTVTSAGKVTSADNLRDTITPPTAPTPTAPTPTAPIPTLTLTDFLLRQPITPRRHSASDRCCCSLHALAFFSGLRPLALSPSCSFSRDLCAVS
ncbi:unnamed protein product, partial [Tilletia laevis]